MGIQVFKFRQSGTVANTITNGERVIYTVQIQNDAQLATPSGPIPVCDVTCASVIFRCPDFNGVPGPSVVLTNNLNLPFGTGPMIVGSVTCTVAVASGVASARARVEVIGIVHDVSIFNCSPDATCVNNACDPDVGGGQQEVSVTVRNPCINVFKQCVATTNATGRSVLVSFSGTVTNCGDEDLVNISVVDNQPAIGTVVTNFSSLVVGASVSFSGSYTSTNDLCGPFIDTISVTGTGLGTLATVKASSTAQCPIVYTPAIMLTKVCQPGLVQPGGTLNFSGTVSNAGNVILTNVFVFNDHPTANTKLLGPISLGLGESTNFSSSYVVPLDSCGPYTDTVTGFGTSICGVSVTNSATANCPGTNSPAIFVIKNCPVNPVPPGGTLVISGVVSNAGNITLTNVTVTNVITAIGQNHAILGPITLLPGASVPFTDSYTVPPNSCGPYADTVMARGSDKCFGRLVTASDTKSCPGITSPKIAVVKHCPANPVVPGGVAVFSGTVSNAGNITLTNVVVVNNRPTNNTPVFGPVTLLPGETRSFTGSETVPANCCEYFDTLLATGVNICTGSNVVASASAACPTLVLPRITVTKNCPPNPIPLGQPLVFSGIISNAGNIALINVMVVDNQPSNNTPVIGPLTLAPGETAPYSGSYVVPINLCVTNIADTVTATAKDVCAGSNVTASASALCPILPTPRLTVTKICPASPVAPGQLLVFTGTVSNSGNLTITNIIVVNDRPAPDTFILGPVTLVPGQTIGFNGSYIAPYDCCGPCVDTVTARGNEFCAGSNVVGTATAACPRITTPGLSVTRNCPPGPVTQGDLVFFTGIVSNTGNATLGNVTVIDDQAGDVLDNLVLAPGEAVPYMGMFVTTNCGPNIASGVTAIGNDICTGVVVSNRFVTSCPVLCPGVASVTLFGMKVVGTNFVFSFITEQNHNYTVQYTDSLGPVNWQTLLVVPGDGNTATISDPLTIGSRFYRVLIQ